MAVSSFQPLVQVLLTTVVLASLSGTASAQSVPTAKLTRGQAFALSGSADSNSPAVWDADARVLRVFTSFGGVISQASGSTIRTLGPAHPVDWIVAPRGGVWMESVIDAGDGAWYGYYHNEVDADDCQNVGKVRPRIGAARSFDAGHTWEDLGIILESDLASLCTTPNRYNVGGIGDFSVIRDRDRQYLYVLYSDYSSPAESQGVSVARMPWGDRDRPAGALAVWQDGIWMPAASRIESFVADPDQMVEWWKYPEGTPRYAAAGSWHSANGKVDAFWGPSVHWNTYLEHYVILMSRANTTAFGTEGLYVSFARDLSEPATWSTPQKLQSGGQWYPQVFALPEEGGTESEAGRRAYFYNSGKTSTLVEFTR